MKLRLKSVLAATAVAVCLASMPVFAQLSSPMTDDHIAKIKANCQSARIALGQIHANDIPTYINLNQTYYSISDKLMARLNSRLTFNRYDASELVKTAGGFNDSLSKFKTAYKTYNDAMTDALGIDCTKEPVTFYDKVADARQARQKVHDATSQLAAAISQYRQQVQDFQSAHESSLNGGSNRNE